MLTVFHEKVRLNISNINYTQNNLSKHGFILYNCMLVASAMQHGYDTFLIISCLSISFPTLTL